MCRAKGWLKKNCSIFQELRVYILIGKVFPLTGTERSKSALGVAPWNTAFAGGIWACLEATWSRSSIDMAISRGSGAGAVKTGAVRMAERTAVRGVSFIVNNMLSEIQMVLCANP